MSINATKKQPSTLRSRPAVPWPTVVPLAVAMAYADGFWMTSLRGATGAIERNQAPFASWLRESTLVLPIFVFAVLGALALALHLFGPVLRTPRNVVATVLLVVSAGTLAGIAEVAVSSAYDYHLQSDQLKLMDSMRNTSVGSSLAQQLQATLGLQVHAVAYGAVILLVTNVVLVGWILALRGGRLNLGTIRPATATPDADGTPGSRVDDLRLLLVAGLIASAAIHAAVIPEHLSEWAAAGMFFIVLVAAELAVAARLWLSRRRPDMLLAAAAISIGPLVLWTYSRSLGIPFGPGAGVPEPIGLPDLAAFALELSTLIIAVVLFRSPRWLQRPPTSAHRRWLALTAVIAVTAIGLAGSSLAAFNVFPNSDSQTSMTVAR